MGCIPVFFIIKRPDDFNANGIVSFAFRKIITDEEKYNADGQKQTLFKEKSGDLSWMRPRITDRDEKIAADAVLDAMIIGFRQIEYSYGSKYLVVSEEEVESHA